MRLLRYVVILSAAAMAVSVSAGAAEARGYTGAWPVTVSRSHHSDGTYCLTLTDNGSYGWRHSGSASLVIGSQKCPFGSGQVINGTLIAAIQAQGYGQNAGLVFVGSASRGNLGPGVFEDVYGGSDFDSGALAFGMRGGC